MSTEEIVKTPAKKKAAPKAEAKPKAVKAVAAEPTVKTAKVTKPKAAKPAKPVAVDAPVELKPIPVPTHAEIAQLAVQYWIERGYEHGQAEQDWFRAEQQLCGIAS
jgi:Protein of unknown function (DUF2934)